MCIRDSAKTVEWENEDDKRVHKETLGESESFTQIQHIIIFLTVPAIVFEILRQASHLEVPLQKNSAKNVIIIVYFSLIIFW